MRMKNDADEIRAEDISRTEPESGMVFPGIRWEITSPENQGVDPIKLQRALTYLAHKTGKDGISEVVLVRNGRIIWQGDRATIPHNVWSCTKVFTSTILGLLIDQGKCSLDTLAKNHLEQLAPMYSGVTLKHFATMTSGYDGGGDQSRNPLNPTSPLFAPGTRFRYWDSAMNQFLNVLTRIAGEPARELFRRSVADPIGLAPEKWEWKDFGSFDGLLVNGGAGNLGKGIHISALEMARFGHLFLNRGEWAGRQLLSASWVDLATSPQVSADMPLFGKGTRDGPGRYGFNWWSNGIGRYGRRRWPAAPPQTYAARGFNNNRCFVIPEWKMVVVRQGQDGDISERTYNRLFKRLGKALATTAIMPGVRAFKKREFG